MKQFSTPYLEALYTNGTPVIEGDKIRSRQSPGGIMSPGKGNEGIAGKCPWDESGTLYLVYTRPDRTIAYQHIFSHITEKI